MSRAKQYETKEKKCEHCGSVFEVCTTVWHKARFCPQCRQWNATENEKRRRREHSDEKRRNKPRESKIILYKMIRDVDGSWGFNTHLTRDAINRSIRDGNLEPGVEFMHILTGKKYRVCHKNKEELGLRLVKI